MAGRRGMFQWRLQVRGRSAHSGLHFWQGRSALVAAARWCAEAAALSRRGGPTINTGRLVAEAPGLGRVGRLAVHRGLRGSGHGAALLRALEAVALARGERAVTLHAQRSAEDFYLRLGYEVCGEPFELGRGSGREHPGHRGTQRRKDVAGRE